TRNTICRYCAVDNAMYQCRDCFGGGELLCKACIVHRHAQLPFHRVQEWTGLIFECRTLKTLGLHFQLGHWHERVRVCPVPLPAWGDDFVIVDSHGVHEVGLDYCGCASSGSGSQTVQLLRAHLYPATTTNPRSAATFNVMRRFHLLSFKLKCSAYEFYNSLARETDNSGLLEVKDRYHEFLRMTRDRHLQMLKRAGCGLDPEGVVGTKEGECTLLCPACPQPGKNLPPGWKDSGDRFKYALFVAIDANFRLKWKDVSSEEKDPGLGKGWAFFCEVEAYMEHVKANWGQVQERSHCVAHDAVDKPDREARGTASSGIGAVDCARHNMKRPNAVGDLQLGERYINMDYMFFKSIAGSELIRFFVLYDIACQWHINIWMQMTGYNNEAITIRGRDKFMTWLVPKFHLPAHIRMCNLLFSFNLTRYVGWTDGEAPERGWANTNPLASSTKEMGPGSRRDTLNDHFNDWNFKKIIALGKTMLERTQDAVPMMVTTREALVDLEASFEEATLVEWRKMVEAWEGNLGEPNPFESSKKDEHLAEVQRELAVEAAERIETIGAVREDMHFTELIAMGLQLEEQQRVLRFDEATTGLHPSAKQRTALIERTSKLRRKIFTWAEIQKLFFPVVETLRKQEDDAQAHAAGSQPVPGLKVQELTLWLPSALKRRAGRGSDADGCTPDVLSCEYCLRVGQANEALHDVRRQLLVRTHLYKLKDHYTRGVKANTCSKTKIDMVDEGIRRAAAQYRDAWAALGVLGRKLGRQEWEATLKELKHEDVRSQPRSAEGDAVGQQGGTKKAAAAARLAEEEREGWTAGANDYRIALRIEWAKTRARSLQWLEEVDLLEEEMRHIEQFLRWRSGWWENQVGRKGLEDGPQREGDTAWRQAKLQRELCESFCKVWTKAGLQELIARGRGGGFVGEVVLLGAQGEEEEEDAARGSSGEEEDPIPEMVPRPVGPIGVE
ncbi:hypothetical protein C8R44DRAFT_645647, partial [Mycena epipterygia]